MRLPRTAAALIENIPPRQLRTPHDVAIVALLLALDGAPIITGTCLDVTGGPTVN